MFKKLFKYFRYKFLRKKKFKYRKIRETSISISYIEFEYNIIYETKKETKKYKTGFIQFTEKSDFFL